MPSIVCPKCGNSVFAVAAGSAVTIKGDFDGQRCDALRAELEAGADIDDALECPEMEAAVEAALRRMASAT